MKKKIIGLLSLLILAGAAAGCRKDFLNTEPSSSLSDKRLAQSKEGITGVMNGIHNMFYMYSFGQGFGNGALSLSTQLDFLGNTVVNSLPAIYMSNYRWTEHRDPHGTLPYYAWDYHYTVIQHCNTLLKMTAEDSKTIEPKTLQALRGEAKVVRAYCYNVLTSLFGQRYVPGTSNDTPGVILRLLPTIDPMPRASVAECYAQIVKDIEEGISDLEKGTPQTKKNRITIPTAYGIAARIYLMMQDYAKAEAYAGKAIQTFKGKLQSGQALLDDFNNLDATEWMWGYTQATDQNNYYAGYAAHYSYNFNSNKVSSLRFAVNRSYYDKMGEKDVRRKWFVALDRGDKIPATGSANYFKGGTKKPNWETTGQCIKFGVKTLGFTFMDHVMMRLGEMYYIKAEAQARQGKVAEAAATLNTVMKSRDPEYVADTKLSAEDLAKEIMRNKRIDMYFEGQEFFDIKRLGEVPNRLAAGNDKYMTEVAAAMFRDRNSGKNAEAMPKDANDKVWQFLIPYQELKGNKLCKQNPQ